MSTLNIGLFGCGVVGSGVYRILQEQRARITEQTGVRLNISKVAVLHPEKRRAVDLPPEVVTTNGSDILDDPSIDIVVEVIGGEREALGIISRALVGGLKVVTANKVVVSKHLARLKRLEDLHGGQLSYGAAVCGSIPILKVIDETLGTDRILSLRGIVNGSTNFLLSRLSDGYTWDESLDLARELGFLEADPTADISGADAAHKLSILIFHAFGVHITPDQIQTTGIEAITAADAAAAKAAGGTIKLVAQATESLGEIVASVAPRVVPNSDPLAWVRDEVNIVELDCDGVGAQRFTGKGAGSIPTANAVVSDLLDIVAQRKYRRQIVTSPAPIARHAERRELLVA